jgi:hypothetical protein
MLVAEEEVVLVPATTEVYQRAVWLQIAFDIVTCV